MGLISSGGCRNVLVWGVGHGGDAQAFSGARRALSVGAADSDAGAGGCASRAAMFLID